MLLFKIVVDDTFIQFGSYIMQMLCSDNSVLINLVLKAFLSPKCSVLLYFFPI